MLKIKPTFEIKMIPMKPRKFLFFKAFLILKNVSLMEITGSAASFSSLSDLDPVALQCSVLLMIEGLFLILLLL